MKIENKYDHPGAVKARKNQEDPWVLYLIVRESLGMSTGKIAAQVGHAVGMVYDKHIHHLLNYAFGGYDDEVNNFKAWRNESFRKITLKADDKEWTKVKEQCECFVVRDAGLTQVKSGSETVIALFPQKKSLAPKIIRKLQILG